MGCQEQFDCYCKKVLRNYARSYGKKLRNNKKRECFFEDAYKDPRLQQYFSIPPYEESYIFKVKDMDVAVKDFYLGAALEKLEEHQREIVLLSYFLEMTDKEIAEHLNLIRRTVAYRRGATLKQLKKFLEAYLGERKRMQGKNRL